MGMNKPALVAVVAVAVAGGVAFWRSTSPPAEAAAPKVPMSKEDREMAVAQARLVVDVEGLPPLFPEGRENHPVNPISLADYFVNYGASVAIDIETKQIKREVASKLDRELVGKQVSWDGYVSRIRDLPSGRVTLVIAPRPDGPPLDVALIKYSAALSEQIHSYQKGDRVRVVAVYDKLETLFPSLRGLEVTRSAEAGLVSGS